jgi:predicted nucleic acid-binding protein
LFLTIDTFAWLEVIRGTEIGRRAQASMGAANRCLTPSIVLAEVASKCHRDGFVDKLVLLELAAIMEASEVVPINSEIALSASHCVDELRSRARAGKLPPPGLADGLVLATARRHSTRILTGDPHFRGLTETVWLG